MLRGEYSVYTEWKDNPVYEIKRHFETDGTYYEIIAAPSKKVVATLKHESKGKNVEVTFEVFDNTTRHVNFWTADTTDI